MVLSCRSCPHGWVGLVSCDVFLFGGAYSYVLVDEAEFCLSESAVSSSTFWGVYGFSMSLGNPSGFGIFRHVYFCSIPSLPPAPYLSLESLAVLLFLDPTLHCRREVARERLVWIFPQLPDPALCITDLRGLPSAP